MASINFSWNGDAIAKQVQGQARNGLRKGAEYLLQQANQTVPLEEGNLQASGSADVDPGGMSATVSYDAPYARRQHEMLNYHHAPGRRAKWLESALNEQTPQIMQIIGNEIKL